MILKAENITKSFNKQESSITVLSGVDISVMKGEYASIIGSSGAGKSTLLQILATLSNADSGSVKYIFDEEINPFTLSDKNLSKVRNEKIGFIFQFHHLLPEFTAYENVVIPAMISGKKEKEFKKKALELIDYVGVGSRMNHKPTELSGGEQQRFAIARALINEPEIVFADEPTGNLDENNTELVLDLISKIQKEFNLTFLTATHSSQVAEKASTRYRIMGGKMEIIS